MAEGLCGFFIALARNLILLLNRNTKTATLAALSRGVKQRVAREKENAWLRGFSAELYSRILLDQNEEEDVFDVWVANKEELESLAGAFESIHRCTVIRDCSGFITVCLPNSYIAGQ